MEEDLKINALERPYAPERDAVPLRWEPEYVGRKLVAAFVTLDRLPRVRGPRDPGRHWPEHAVEWADQLAHAELDDAERRAREFQQNRTILRPTSADIAGMDAAFDWLRELRRVDPGMALVTSLWALYSARHRSIRQLCIAKHWAPHTLYRKRAKALAHLAQWLKVRAVPVF
ncbi:MAG: hypothetical protein ACLQIQ_08710 [Beijerinckiaceae bacterium]